MIPPNYYTTKHWLRFSKELLEDKNCVCQMCGRPRWKLVTRGKNKGKWKRLLKFAVHHKNYDHVFHETRDDVLILCSACHTNAHAALRARNASPFHEKVAELYESVGFVYKKDTN